MKNIKRAYFQKKEFYSLIGQIKWLVIGETVQKQSTVNAELLFGSFVSYPVQKGVILRVLYEFSKWV